MASHDRKRRLRNLIAEGTELNRHIKVRSDEETLPKVEALQHEADSIICEGDLKERAEHPSELVLDSHVTKMNTELLQKIVHQKRSFDFQAFKCDLEHIIGTSERFPYDWEALGLRLCKSGLVRTFFTAPSMLNVYNKNSASTVRKPKQRQQRKKTILAPEKAPLTVSDIQTKDPVAEKVNAVASQIRQLHAQNNNKPIPYYRLIVDPQNYNNTIQFAFFISFLIKDNALGIVNGEDGYPLVHVQKDKPKGNVATTQGIATITMKLWQHMIKKYNIRKPMLSLDLSTAS